FLLVALRARRFLPVAHTGLEDGVVHPFAVAVVGDDHLVLHRCHLVVVRLQMALGQLVLRVVRALMTDVALQELLVQLGGLHALALVEVLVGTLEHRLGRCGNSAGLARATDQERREQEPRVAAAHLSPRSCHASMRDRARSTICPESPRSLRITSRYASYAAWRSPLPS